MSAVRDCCFLAGLALVGVGLWLVHPAACLVGTGSVLIGCSVWGTINAARQPPR